MSDHAVPSHGTEMLRPPGSGSAIAACPACLGPCPDGARFCESCGAPLPGHDASVPGDVVWMLTVVADRAQFDRCETDGLAFPDGRLAQTFVIGGTLAVIGRSGHEHDDPVDVDLSAEIGDPAVSRRHAVVEVLPDGRVTVTDLGSTNGTTLDHDPTPIVAHTAVEVGDGSRLHLGAWTTIVVERRRQRREHTAP